MTRFPEPVARQALSTAEAAAAACVGRSSIFNAIAAGELVSVRVGKRRLVLPEDLRAWLLAKREQRAEPPTGRRGRPRKVPLTAAAIRTGDAV